MTRISRYEMNEKNKVREISHAGSTVRKSILHKCCQCGGEATDIRPLFKFSAVVDLTKRKENVQVVNFYAHGDCLQVRG